MINHINDHTNNTINTITSTRKFEPISTISNYNKQYYPIIIDYNHQITTPIHDPYFRQNGMSENMNLNNNNTIGTNNCHSPTPEPSNYGINAIHGESIGASVTHTNSGVCECGSLDEYPTIPSFITGAQYPPSPHNPSLNSAPDVIFEAPHKQSPQQTGQIINGNNNTDVHNVSRLKVHSILSPTLGATSFNQPSTKANAPARNSVKAKSKYTLPTTANSL